MLTNLAVVSLHSEYRIDDIKQSMQSLSYRSRLSHVQRLRAMLIEDVTELVNERDFKIADLDRIRIEKSNEVYKATIGIARAFGPMVHTARLVFQQFHATFWKQYDEERNKITEEYENKKNRLLNEVYKVHELNLLVSTSRSIERFHR